MNATCPAVSILTATLNAREKIEGLFVSLSSQDHSAFEWVVVDGGSVDGTVELLQEWSLNHSWIRYVSEPDFGFYDALNKAVRKSRADYYIVVGADDTLAEGAITSYLEDAAGADVVLAKVEKNGKICGGFYPKMAWFGHQRVFGGSHSVGMMFKRSLHQELGYYSSRFPLLADGYFLKKLLRTESVVFRQSEFVAGHFATDGLSNSGKLQSLAETWQIQMLTDGRPLLQTLLFLLKLIGRLSFVRQEISVAMARVTRYGR